MAFLIDRATSFFTGVDAGAFEDPWADVACLIDAPARRLALVRGERELGRLEGAEDVRGSTGERGTLRLTSLRLTWASARAPGRNVSVGLGAVTALATREAPSRVRGDALSLLVAAKGNDGARLEFLFAAPRAPGGGGAGAGATAAAGAPASAAAEPPAAPAASSASAAALFAHAAAALGAYEESRAYRDVRLRAPIIRDRAAVLLPGERLVSVTPGVSNLSADQGNLGVLTLTTLRAVWHASFAENFNVSVPWPLAQDVRVAASKFGPALVLELGPRGGDFLLGFQAATPAAAAALAREMAALRGAALAAPNWGVALAPLRAADADGAAAAAAAAAGAPAAPVDEDAVVDGHAEGVHAGVLGATDVYAAYYEAGGGAGGRAHAGGGEGDADGGAGGGGRRVALVPILGLAFEDPPPGLTLDALWAAV